MLLLPGDLDSRRPGFAEAVAEAVRQERRPVVVSGDCTTALGTVAGLQHAGMDPGTVWFDAYGDVQTLDAIASGYLGGLALDVIDPGAAPKPAVSACRRRRVNIAR